MTKKPSVPKRLRRQVQERAQGRCEYCLIHESDMYYPHEVALLHLNDAERPAYRLGLVDIGHYPAR